MIKIGMLLPYEDMLLIAKRVYEATDESIREALTAAAKQFSLNCSRRGFRTGGSRFKNVLTLFMMLFSANRSEGSFPVRRA